MPTLCVFASGMFCLFCEYLLVSFVFVGHIIGFYMFIGFVLGYDCAAYVIAFWCFSSYNEDIMEF